jgi:hypothetical protein
MDGSMLHNDSPDPVVSRSGRSTFSFVPIVESRLLLKRKCITRPQIRGISWVLLVSANAFIEYTAFRTGELIRMSYTAPQREKESSPII